MTLAVLRAVPPEHRTAVPRGLRNHLHWQAGHIVTVQASLLYLRSGLTPFLDDSYFTAYAKGTSPAGWTGEEPSYDTVLGELGRSLDILKTDFPRYSDHAYPAPIAVSTGDTLTSFADALRFLPLHEAIHLGTINTMVRILGVNAEKPRITQQ